MSRMMRRIQRDQKRLQFIDDCKLMLLAALLGILSTQLGELYLWFTSFQR